MHNFVLTGVPRTGTTVVAGALLQHPDVLCYGELFHGHDGVRHREAARISVGAGWQFDRPLDCGVRACSKAESGAGYLEELFQRSQSGTATGFKLLLDQAQQGANRDVWEYIAASETIRIIETHRPDLLQVICSFARASITKHWHSAGGSPPPVQFAISPEDFVKLVERFNTKHPAYSGVNSDRILRIDYDDICADFSGCMARIYDFIGVPVLQQVKPRLQKIATRDPRQELANYNELLQAFRGTPYEAMFDYCESR
jgi:LPS sulfotransferase NodH